MFLFGSIEQFKFRKYISIAQSWGSHYMYNPQCSFQEQTMAADATAHQ
jgi:hypothetical protein